MFYFMVSQVISWARGIETAPFFLSMLVLADVSSSDVTYVFRHLVFFKKKVSVPFNRNISLASLDNLTMLNCTVNVLYLIILLTCNYTHVHLCL